MLFSISKSGSDPALIEQIALFGPTGKRFGSKFSEKCIPVSILDRNILPANSTPSVIHEQFGEAWKANKSAWIFSVYEYYVQIENDTEHGKGLVPQYEANFPTEAERIEAETVYILMFITDFAQTENEYLK